MIRLLIVVGASILVLLGAAHGVLTLKDLNNPRTFTPRDAALRTAMQQSTIALSPKINLWRAWLGFNLTHSLGIVLFGGAFLYLGAFYPSLFAQSLSLQACAVLVSAAYLVTSLNFFFSTPTMGASISTGCFFLAVILSHV